MDENPRGKSSHVIWNENGFLVAKKKVICCSQQGGRRLRLPLLVASHVGEDVQGSNPFLFTSLSHLLRFSSFGCKVMKCHFH